jgi:hypothetical protein
MKLCDLEPAFLDYRLDIADEYHGRPQPDGTVQWRGFSTDTFHEQSGFTGADGVKFLCPKCFAANGGAINTHEVHVYFGNSDVPAHIGKDSNGQTVRWSASGTGLEDLTLSPSIHVVTGCGWHGFVQNGEVSII